MAVDVIPPRFTWPRRLYELNKHFSTDDLANFRNWSTVTEALYTANSPAALSELSILQSSNDWDRWRLIDQAPINGTLIHQAFSLWQWESFTGKRIDELDTIAEFGAGYGEMAKLCFALGFTGQYRIFDFPELIRLQRSFIGDNDQIVYCDDVDQWDTQCDLFIAICSLSEAPVELRSRFLSAQCSNLIRYQDWFDGVDNSIYFAEFANTLHHHRIQRCEHFTPHWYLVSEAN